MAPKGKAAAKRGAAAGAAPEAKKQKLDPMVAAVMNALQQADLPEDCRSMLVAMVPNCFAVPCDHESQIQVASWIEEVLNARKATLQAALDALEQEAAEGEAKEAAVARVTAELEAAGKDLVAKAVAEAEAQAAGAGDAAECGESRLQVASQEKKEAEVVQHRLAEALAAAKAAAAPYSGVKERRKEKATELDNLANYGMECLKTLQSRMAPAGA